MKEGEEGALPSRLDFALEKDSKEGEGRCIGWEQAGRGCLCCMCCPSGYWLPGRAVADRRLTTGQQGSAWHPRRAFRRRLRPPPPVPSPKRDTQETARFTWPTQFPGYWDLGPGVVPGKYWRLSCVVHCIQMVLTWVVGLPSAGRTRGLVLAVDAAAGLSHIQRFHSLSLLAVGYAGVLDPGCSRLAAAAVALLLPSSTKRHTTDPVILELDVEHAELAQSHAFRA